MLQDMTKLFRYYTFYLEHICEVLNLFLQYLSEEGECVCVCGGGGGGGGRLKGGGWGWGRSERGTRGLLSLTLARH